MLERLKMVVCTFLKGPDTTTPVALRYTPFVIIWTFYTAFVGLVMAVAMWVNKTYFFNSHAYDWVTLIMPLEIWAILWILIFVHYLIGMYFVRRPHRSVVWFRRQITLHACLQGVWWVSIIFETFGGLAITAVLMWLGPFIGSLFLLMYGRFFPNYKVWIEDVHKPPKLSEKGFPYA